MFYDELEYLFKDIFKINNMKDSVKIDNPGWTINKTTKKINSDDGLFYENVDYTIPQENRYYERIKSFVHPYRMFAKPIIE